MLLKSLTKFSTNLGTQKQQLDLFKHLYSNNLQKLKILNSISNSLTKPIDVALTLQMQNKYKENPFIQNTISEVEQFFQNLN